ncbi:hypothetical protein NECAME_00126 [Necator americanus]|uniref:Conserved oligomeric Golgi complex subunit 7 n=1 Tax=Necator americanus TaxID=51031 RepID=W2U1T1_NECAM|nr:hypothetical protein NECAME_00126 [Necator americanus]ETN87267.1 hypothetical protein NECAME_00126 [Necator americanus]
MPRELNGVHSNNSAASLSSLCDGLPHEERRKALNNHFCGIQKQYDDTVAEIEKAKNSIEEARVKYENMNDMIRTLEQLRCSLEQHIRTVRLNESSFAGTSSVLEYDAAKSRTNNLISVIKAKSQWDRARELLKEEGQEDQQKMYECLADMQTSQETLAKFVPSGFDTKEFEDMKDRFLAWQSAALIFAIQQADFEKLAEIQKTYESLGRKDEFVSIFRRVSINRLREFSADGPSVQSIIDALYKELEFVFTHHHKVLRRFLDDDAASTLLFEAIQEGLKELDLTDSFSNRISADENPIELLQKTSQFLDTRSDLLSKTPYLTNISHQLRTEVVHDLETPFRSALTTYVLSKINAVDLKCAVPKDSRMTNLPAFSTSPHEYITSAGQELLQLFHLWEQFFLDDNVVHSFYIALKKKFEGEELFKKTVADVANSVITEFVSSVGDPTTYSKEVAKQFHADTVFLKDAFEDLRTGNVEQLSALEARLKNVLKV